MLKLEEVLGRAFTGSVPTMNQAELRNPSERLVVTYGITSFSASQGWIKNVARIEHVAPIAWDKISENLDVGRAVTRCGVRFILAARADDAEHAQAMVARCHLAPSSDAWKGLSTDGVMRAYSAVIEDARGRLRLSVESTEIKVEGALPAELEQLVPRHALTLDVDSVHPGKGPYSLSKAGLKDFIRSSWQRSREVATLVGTQLGIRDA